ncbi:MAG: peptide chain release factor 2 [Candidatus Kerfeldbacteria bacterium]|nr:peptide chain release factor 2 [Candidatus Kerfeldbacteria bacterium]
MDELIQTAQALADRLDHIGKQLNIAGMKTKLHALQVEMTESDFWSQPHHAQQVSKTVNDLQTEVNRWEGLQTDLTTITELAELNRTTPDPDITAELQHKLQSTAQQFQQLEFQLLLGGSYDDYPALIGVHAGAGGVDAQDWADMLLRMVLRYCEQRGLTAKTIDVSPGNEAGIKSAILEVTGRYAYGYLRSEHGVHRLVRQSPFNADALRQTSFALIEVLPDLGELNPIEIKEEDLRIDVFRSGGHGGQSVNTTDSAVRITHLPTGTVVTCQNERSQHQNKATAMKILKAKLHTLELEKHQAEAAKLRGEYTSAEWGNQIRSYVLHPYKLVKDHRTDYEETDPSAVLDGHLDGFVEAYLRHTITARVSNDDVD